MTVLALVVCLIEKNPYVVTKQDTERRRKHSKNNRGNADGHLQQCTASNVIHFILCTYIIEHYSNCFAVLFHFFTSFFFFKLESVLPNVHEYKIFLLIVQSNGEKYQPF